MPKHRRLAQFIARYQGQVLLSITNYEELRSRKELPHNVAFYYCRQ